MLRCREAGVEGIFGTEAWHAQAHLEPTRAVGVVGVCACGCVRLFSGMCVVLSLGWRVPCGSRYVWAPSSVCAVCCATALPTLWIIYAGGEDPLALDGVQWLATGPERTMCVPVVGPERTWCAPGFALLAGRSPMLFLCLKRVFPSSALQFEATAKLDLGSHGRRSGSRTMGFGKSTRRL